MLVNEYPHKKVLGGYTTCLNLIGVVVGMAFAMMTTELRVEALPSKWAACFSSTNALVVRVVGSTAAGADTVSAGLSSNMMKVGL